MDSFNHFCPAFMTSHIRVLSGHSGLCAAGFLSLCMLVSACGGGGDVALSRSYWGRAPLAADTPAAGVTALGAALGEAMTVFAAELADAI